MVQQPCGPTIQVTLHVTQDIRNGPEVPRVNLGCKCDMSGQTHSWARHVVILPMQWRMWGHGLLVGQWSLGGTKDGAIKVGPDSRMTVLLHTDRTHPIPCSSDHILQHIFLFKTFKLSDGSDFFLKGVYSALKNKKNIIITQKMRIQQLRCLCPEINLLKIP